MLLFADVERSLDQLSSRTFDVAIIGGGIYGAALLREAALCGLSAVLVEKGDFCGRTSANSLKIIHGGLRYLQQADLIRVRESVRERRTMLRLAPHLVLPLACAMPTHGFLLKSRAAMFAGLLANDILSADRNRRVPAGRELPAGKVVAAEVFRRLLPDYPGSCTGAAVWYDAFAYDTERLVLGMIRSAVDAGACAANYVAFTGFLAAKDRIEGIRVHDAIGGDSFDIRAKLVINAAGPWSNDVLARTSAVAPLPYVLALGLNAVLKRELIPGYAVGLPSQEAGPDKGRLLFFAPWRGVTMGGTYYRHHRGVPGLPKPADQDIDRLLSQLKSALPSAGLTRDDIGRVHAGFIPCKPDRPDDSYPEPLRHYKLVDHARRDGVEGLVTVLGVKYTTARDVAQRAIHLASRKLGMSMDPSRSEETPLPGGDIPDIGQARDAARARLPVPVSDAAFDRLFHNYGTHIGDIAALRDDDGCVLTKLNATDDVFRTEVLYALRHEMAQHISDVIYRRTGLGGARIPDDAVVAACAQLMAAERSWTAERTASEIASARDPLA